MDESKVGLTDGAVFIFELQPHIFFLIVGKVNLLRKETVITWSLS